MGREPFLKVTRARWDRPTASSPDLAPDPVAIPGMDTCRGFRHSSSSSPLPP
ncbi:hypothetical protein KPATCC21470_0461 [Kitasatospora purpeofusca]